MCTRCVTVFHCKERFLRLLEQHACCSLDGPNTLASRTGLPTRSPGTDRCFRCVLAPGNLVTCNHASQLLVPRSFPLSCCSSYWNGIQ
jgi:hypothetical protein